MKVYVVNYTNCYPDVDGIGFIIGVYSSAEKAEEAADRARPGIEQYLDPFGTSDKELYDISIEEFDMDDLV